MARVTNSNGELIDDVAMAWFPAKAAADR